MINARQFLRTSSKRALSVILPCLAAALFALPAARSEAQYLLGPYPRISGSDPFAGNTLDNPSGQSGTLYPSSTVEPWVSINPANPLQIVATYQQDRWSSGGARGLVEAWSNDGGLTWHPV